MYATKGSALHSVDETEKDIIEKTSDNVLKLQVQELVVKLAQDFNAFYEIRETFVPETSRDLLLRTFDGKSVVMRQERLRKATRQAAERGEAVLKIRALHCSENFYEYVEFHKVQELRCNHLSHFQKSPLLAAAYSSG